MNYHFLFLALLVSSAVAAQHAVIVVGSRYYWNYRHQADGCHAYVSLREKGIPAENIILMSYDDVANSPSNPFPGKLFNRPDPTGPGRDVYADCKIDYRGEDVTAPNFLAVITGDKKALAGVGNGKVLQSTDNDTVFLNFADHGGVGLIAMPVGPYLYADELIKALVTMNKQKMYKKLVFYMEACESGSMFEGKLPDSIDIYVTTAANAHESSWGTYCGSQAVVNGTNLNTCLGDLYSVTWMENLDASDGSETLEQQFTKIKAKVDGHSHVQQYGDLNFTNLPISVFEGHETSVMRIVPEFPHMFTASSRDIQLEFYYRQYMTSSIHGGSDQWAAQLQKEIIERTEVDLLFHKFSLIVFPNHHADYMNMRFLPLNMQCLKMANAYYEDRCQKFNDYSLKYVNLFNTVCMIADDPINLITKSIDQICF